ncbi:MAG: CoA transferase, partial [Gemmatimonadaceae bacterium]|nr:CoA transferase [Acetobacteraceae bacterium]
DVPDLARHPALRRTPVQTPNGPAHLVAPPVIVDALAPALGPVPAIGQHSAQIRHDFPP